jgi:branched-subunit amino acid aminotransferase/4-amino-4-deoxychorismate lyase
VAEAELPALDEAILLGTANDVMPVIQFNNIKLGNGRPGPVTRQLQQAFRELALRERQANA